jgi:Glycosyltransferase family 87
MLTTRSGQAPSQSLDGVAVSNRPKAVLIFALVYAAGAAVVWYHIFSAIQQNLIQQGSGEVIDFVRWYAAASIARKDQHREQNVYDVDVLLTEVSKIAAPTVVPTCSKFFYPPCVLTLLIPLTLLACRQAWLVWSLIGLGTTAVALWVANEGGGWRRFSVPFLGTAAFCATWYNFRVGQTAVLVLLGMSVLFHWLRHERFFLSGCAASLLLLKPQYAPFACLAGLFLGKLRFAYGLAAGLALMVAMSLWQSGWVGLSNFLSVVSTKQLHHNLEIAESMENVRGLVLMLFPASQTQAFVIALTVFLVGALAVGRMWHAYPRLQANDAGAFDLCCASTVLASLVLSVHAFSYDYMSLSLAAICLWRWSEKAPITEGYRRKLRLFLLLLPLLSWTSYLSLPLLQLLKSAGVGLIILGYPLFVLSFRILFASSLVLMAIGERRIKATLQSAP